MMKKPFDLDGLIDADAMLAWIGGNKNRRWLLKHARSGKIPAVKLGGEWRFHPRTVLAQCGTGIRSLSDVS
jgi:hypothetical protein